MVMPYKSSFHSLRSYENGIYTAYNLSLEEKKLFKSRFREIQIKDDTYIAYDYAKFSVYLELYIHKYWVLQKFDITNDIFNYFGRNLSNEEFLKISEVLKEQKTNINVLYNIKQNEWLIDEQDKINLLEKIKRILSE